jgi:general secretion pathway protein I
LRPIGGQAARCPPYVGLTSDSAQDVGWIQERSEQSAIVVTPTTAAIPRTPPTGPRQRGFTLLEVLVALAIFASVAAVLLTASARSLQNAARLEEKALAGWVADNYLTELQLAEIPPETGNDSRELAFGGRQWQLYSETVTTSDPGLRRVNLWVALPPSARDNSPVKERSTLTLTGFVGVRQ